MKNKFFKKSFWLVGSSALVTASVVAPTLTLTSCSKIKGFMIDDTDEETGISSVTYETMKKEFRDLYINHLKKHEFLSDIEIKEKLVFFDDYISNFDEMLAKNDGAVMDYTAATMALSETASEKYGIRLNRRSNVTWSDFVEQYKGLRQSTFVYMTNQGLFPQEIQQILNDGDARFNDLVTTLSREYAHDPLLGITKAQNKLLDVFSANNREVALVASMNRLADFTNRYTFQFNEDSPIYYDTLRDPTKYPDLKVGSPIDPGIMNTVFTCIDQQTGTPTDFDPTKSMPTFIITPYLHGWYEDKYSNQYGMEIDWQIYPSIYWTEPSLRTYIPEVTAHVYGRNDKIANREIEEDSKDPDYFVKTIHESEIQTTRYMLQASARYERENLVNAYFNKDEDKTRSRIYLKWEGGAGNKRNKYECFFDGIPQGEDEGLLSVNSLANSGLRISSNDITYEDLKTVIKRVEKDKQDPENATPDEKLPLTDKFIKYCTVQSAVVSEDGQYGTGHKVRHKFFYQYANSVKGDTSIVNDPDYSEPRRSDGFNISEEFFNVANDKYNDAFKLFRHYKNNDFVAIKENCNDLEAGFVSTSVMTGVQIAKNVIKMIFGGIATKLIAAYTIALLTSNAVVLGIIWPFYTHYLVDPIDTFVSNVKKLRNDPSYKSIQNRLEEDSQYFVTVDEDGWYSQDEYDAKKITFQTSNFVTFARPKYQYYSTIMIQDDFTGFKAAAKRLHVDPMAFKKEFGTWMYTGTSYIACYGYAGIRMLLNQLILPELKTPWLLFIAEFAIETLLGMNITKILQETAFSYTYEE
ncbi:MAG: hypothetical protein KBS35_01880 [Mycoplasma sp.]|nr:hypothetical protein [Candidatus Hennigella equi]